MCGIKLDRKTKNTVPLVDHCHKTGIVRGILCREHNLVEGMIGSPENALALYHYMSKNSLFYSGGP